MEKALMGNLMGIPSGKPVAFFPISHPTPRRGWEMGKARSGNSHQNGKRESGNEKTQERTRERAFGKAAP